MSARRAGPRPALLAILFASLLVAGCANGTDVTVRDWAAEVRGRLAGDAVPQEVIDCVLNVARVELERNPLSADATDELVRNCELARAAIEDARSEPEPEPVQGDQPQTFGDDPGLDALWTSCADGSGAACNELFDAAPMGSGYEDFGVSCGDRPEVLHCDELDLADTGTDT